MKALLNTIKTISTGFIVLMLLSLLLFWLRLLCNSLLLENASQYNINEVTIKPSGLLPENIENDPNITQNSFVNASFSIPNLKTLGIVNYLLHIAPGSDSSNFYDFIINRTSGGWSRFYLDKQKGLIVYHSTKTVINADYTEQKNNIIFYAGPEGISDVPDKKLGKFTGLLVNKRYFSGNFTLYDKNLRRFFSIDFNEKKVIKGPQLSKDDTHKPVQIGLLEKNSYIISLKFNPPLITASNTDKEQGSYRKTQDDNFARDIFYNLNKYLLVLDETNRIYLLDKQTLEFACA